MLLPLPLSLLFVLVLPVLHAANIHQSIPEDLCAFPKYRTSFLVGLPVSNETAQKWLTHGLRGGELEFLGQWHGRSPKEIESGVMADQQQSYRDEQYPMAPPDHDQEQPPPPLEPTLELMRLGPSRSYLCLIPPAPSLPPPPPDETSVPITPSHSWSLLKHLLGTCLYHRQGWFTYSYCHNQHVRQFRERPVAYPHPLGARVVEEDPEWESYTLGKSPLAENAAMDGDGQLSVNDELALANNLELAAQGAGQRYLVQRWGDGTVCDKTGQPREIEVQFHCSMTMTDTILFVKETRTCEYVLVIHTPRLCGEPGFKSRLEQVPEAAIQCREILNPTDSAAAPSPPGLLLPGAPRKRKTRPPSPPPLAPLAQQVVDSTSAGKGTAADTMKNLQRLFEKMIANDVAGNGEEMAIIEIQAGDNEGEFVISVDDGESEAGEGEKTPRKSGSNNGDNKAGEDVSVQALLEAMGFTVRRLKENDEEEKKDDNNKRS